MLKFKLLPKQRSSHFSHQVCRHPSVLRSGLQQHCPCRRDPSRGLFAEMKTRRLWGSITYHYPWSPWSQLAATQCSSPDSSSQFSRAASEVSWELTYHSFQRTLKGSLDKGHNYEFSFYYHRKFLPSNKSIRGPRMLSAAAATSDLEMAWPWPPPLTCWRRADIFLTWKSIFGVMLKISRQLEI